MQEQLKELFDLDMRATTLPPGVVVDWAPPKGGCRWALGRHSTLTMPCPQVDGDLVLVLTIDPFCCAALPRQVLRVVVNDTTVRLAQFGVRSVVACIIPRALMAGRSRLDVRFEHPDVIQPNMVSDSTDSQGYSVGFVGVALASWRQGAQGVGQTAPRASGEARARPPVEELSDEQLMHHFCSLGDNCEFGIAQRHVDAEPMDLLRFAAMPIASLELGISNGFEAVDKLDDLQFTIFDAGGRREYVLHQRRYELQSHTTVDEGQMSTVRLLARERKKLDVLSRLFRADLSEARRIFVFKRNDVRGSDFAQPLYSGLRSWGPNTLLHVVQGENGHPPGHVEVLADGFLRGYIDRFSPYDNAAAPPSPAWVALCRNSYTLWRQLGWGR